MTEQPISAPTPEGAPTGLTINDLVLALQIIQVSTSRGTFKVDELSAVGGLYDRIFKFLESIGAINKPAPQPPVEMPTPVPDAPTEISPKEAVPKAKKASKPSAKSRKK